jgi:hypothetical protein
VRPIFFVCAAVLALVPSLVASQEPKNSDKDNKTVTITGCVDGVYLRVSESEWGPTNIYNDRLRLLGSKHLLKEISALPRLHKIEVTGRIIDARGTEHAGQTTKIGKKTTVYVGGAAVPEVPNGDTTSTIQVQSFRETGESCSGVL